MKIDDLKATAQEMAEKMIRRKVNFPAEANVTVLRYLAPSKLDGEWKVVGRLTAKNAFGVQRQYNWTMTIQRSQEAVWKEVDSTLDEDR